jgi:integrase
VTPPHDRPLPPRLPHVIERPAEHRFEARLQIDGVRRSAFGKTSDEAVANWLHKWWFRGDLVPSQPSTTSADEDELAPETIGALLDIWLERYVRLHLARRTYNRYRDTAERLRAAFGPIPLSDLKTPDSDAFKRVARRIQRYFDDLIADDAMTTTIAKDRYTLQGAFGWAVAPQGWIRESPMRRVATPTPRPRVSARNARAPRGEPAWIPNSEWISQFLASNRDDPLYAMWVAGWMLGLRPSELVAIGEDSVVFDTNGNPRDFDVHRKMFLDDERDESGRRIWVVEEPKRASYRTLERAPESVLTLLHDQARATRAARSEHPRWDPRWERLLFLKDNGLPYDPASLPYHFGEACKRAGLEYHPPGTMRHYCASQLLEAGFSPTRVGAWLGHENATMVLRTYGHVLARLRTQQSPGEVLDQALGKVASGVASASGKRRTNRRDRTSNAAG